ncbi:pyridoxamine 5'-phosphate oxidase family protein [Gordonia soli]|uniref:Pyridoxamine 5'-phosphate oxidase N-terminal domain-containing protein n=1 Tax=Gordonia soli NBRC 108243 TaxID=1223545 RepID=M0QP42_9ACTN|nr:pyridoxamine 5'-phosphate oxidase family protein [Gordonia soli]GAC70179.1 hypothetical protein GS4_32_01230 [Gordonia soli NBRC 108243]
MGHRYQHLVFGERSLARQRTVGSIVAYGAGLDSPDEGAQEIGEREIRLLTGAFQFHLASVTPEGWPYVQYRSGPSGFLHHLHGNRFAFADFHGNQQFVSVGNIESDDRVSLFVADYVRKTRLKVFGRASVVDAADDPELLQSLRRIGDQEIAAGCERSIVVDVEAFDWNCSRSLIPQYTAEQVRERTQPYIDKMAEMQREIDTLTARLAAE